MNGTAAGFWASWHQFHNKRPRGAPHSAWSLAREDKVRVIPNSRVATSCVDDQCPWVPNDQCDQCPWVINFTSFYSTGNFFELQAFLRQVHRKPPQMTLNRQRYAIYVLPVYTSPKFHSVLLQDEPFSRLQKIGSAPNYLRLKVQSTYPRGPRFGHQPFRETRLSKIGNAPNDFKMTLSTWQAKLPHILNCLSPEAHILVRFALRATILKDNAHLIIPNWPVC